MNVSQRRIYERLVDAISSGRLSPGDKLPTEVELGVQFKTNRLNAHYAVKNLEDAGLVSRNKRGGSVVKTKPSSFVLGKLKSFIASGICVLNQNAAPCSGIHWNERLLASFEGELSAHGLGIDYKNINSLRNLDDYKMLLASLVADGCKALLLVADGSGEGIAFEHPELLSEFHENVYVFDPGQAVWRHFPYNTVSLNLFGEGVLAAERLLSVHGLTRLVAIRQPGCVRHWFEERVEGMACCMKRMQCGTLPEVLGFEEVDRRLLKSLAEESDTVGLVVANDELSAKVIAIAKRAGVSLGDGGLKLVSFDDNRDYRDLGLTTVAPSFEVLGSKLAQMILSGLEKQEDISCLKVHSKVMIRKTA